MAWAILVVAGVFEVVWAYFMKQSVGFTRILPTVFTLVAMFVSVALLSLSMKTLPLGTAYVVWTGIGAVGAFLAGVILLGEAVNPTRVIAAGVIIFGLILMRLGSGSGS